LCGKIYTPGVSRPIDDYSTSDTAHLSCLYLVIPPCRDHNHPEGKEKLVDILNQVTFYEGPIGETLVGKGLFFEDRSVANCVPC